MMAKAIAVLDSELEAVPVIAKPPEQMTTAELLRDTARQGLLRMRDVVAAPLSDNPRERRLQIETAGMATKLYMRAAEGELQVRRTDRMAELLEALRADDETTAPGLSDPNSRTI
jgi:hypothetical protein